VCEHPPSLLQMRTRVALCDVMLATGRIGCRTMMFSRQQQKMLASYVKLVHSKVSTRVDKTSLNYSIATDSTSTDNHKCSNFCTIAQTKQLVPNGSVVESQHPTSISMCATRFMV
jgi:hypothetical protein